MDSTLLSSALLSAVFAAAAFLAITGMAALALGIWLHRREQRQRQRDYLHVRARIQSAGFIDADKHPTPSAHATYDTAPQAPAENKKPSSTPRITPWIRRTISSLRAAAHVMGTLAKFLITTCVAILHLPATVLRQSWAKFSTLTNHLANTQPRRPDIALGLLVLVLTGSGAAFAFTKAPEIFSPTPTTGSSQLATTEGTAPATTSDTSPDNKTAPATPTAKPTQIAQVSATSSQPARNTERHKKHSAKAKNRRVVASAAARRTEKYTGCKRFVSLNAYLERALASQPALLVSRQGIRQAQAGVLNAYTPFLPQLALQGRAQKYHQVGNPGQVISNGQLITAKDQYNTTLTLSASYNLFNGGQDAAGLQEALAKKGAATARLQQQRNTTVFKVLKYYATLEDAEYNLAAAAEVADLRKHNLDMQRRSFRAGYVDMRDLIDAEQRYYQARSQLSQAQQAYAQARAQMTSYLAWDIPRDTCVGSTLPLPPNFESPAKLALQHEIAKNSPSVVAANQALTAARKALNKARGGFWPSVSVYAGYTWDRNSIQSLGDASRHVEPQGYQVGLSFSLPLAPLIGTYSQVDSASAAVASAQARYRQAIYANIAELGQAGDKLQSVRSEEALRKEAVKSAQRLLEIARSRYKRGRGNLVDVNLARIGTIEANNALRQARAARILITWQTYATIHPNRFVPELLRTAPRGTTQRIDMAELALASNR